LYSVPPADVLISPSINLFYLVHRYGSGINAKDAFDAGGLFGEGTELLLFDAQVA
jgi:hypothetical protein